MFRYQTTQIPGQQAVKYEIKQDNEPITFSDFIALLQDDAAFREFFINLLKEIEFRAYHWETPPVAATMLDQPFEFVITKSPVIDLPPDPGPFRNYFSGDSSNKGIAVFDNLGGDAKLIAPKPDGKQNYSHIGVFTRNAPFAKQSNFWQRVGEVMDNQITDDKIWLNNAGGGVAWLHVRLDSRPKYYKHRPYANL